MPPFALILGPDAGMARVAVAGVLAVVVAGCLAGIAWTTRAEVRRRRAPRTAAPPLLDELADLGHSFLLGSPIVLALAVLALAEQGSGLAPGLLAGGAAALTYALVLPTRLGGATRGGADRRTPPGSGLFATVARLRKPWLPVVACAPFFAGVALYLQLVGPAAPEPSPRTFVAGALFGLLHVGTLAWGVQCAQVRRTLQCQARRV